MAAHAATLTLLALLVAPAAVQAVVIDDFRAGPIVVQTSGEQFDEQSAQQTDLPTNRVALGGREFVAQQRTSVVTLAVDVAGPGRLTYDSGGGRSGINTFVSYASDSSVDLTAGGADTLILDFESTAFDRQQSSVGYSTFGFLDVTVGSATGSAYHYVRLPSSEEPFLLAIPFSLLAGFGPTAMDSLQLGTGNGNLDGSFTLLGIETRGVTPGDYNADGSIDAADYAVWRDTADRDFYRYQADGNADGLVDGADWAIWRNAFWPGGAAAPVPEPSSVLTVAFAAWLGIAGRRGGAC